MNYHQSVSAQNLRSVIGAFIESDENTENIERIEIVGFGEDASIQAAYFHFKNSEVKVQINLYDDEYDGRNAYVTPFVDSSCAEPQLAQDEQFHHDCKFNIAGICGKYGYLPTIITSMYKENAVPTAREDVFPLTA
jgi:hypothetical protein